VLKFLKNIYTILLKFIKPNVWVLDCQTKSAKKSLRILYIGTQREKDYFTKTTLKYNYSEKHIGKSFFWSLYYIVDNNKYNASLIVIEGTFLERYLYKSMKDFFVPFWTYTVTDLPLKVTNQSAKSDMRKVQKNKLEYIVTNDSKMIDNFYYNMHKPMIQTRHGDGAYDFLYDEVKETMGRKHNELLLIKKDDTFISGVLMKGSSEIPELWKNGIADLKYWDNGAISAIYIFASEYLAKKGCEKISFGLVRSFLNDGLLLYKKKWNTALSVSGKRGFIFKPCIVSPEIEDFFINNPFIYMKKNKLFGAVFINTNKDYLQEDYQKLKKQHYVKGMSDVNIFSIDKRDKSVNFIECVKKVSV